MTCRFLGAACAALAILFLAQVPSFAQPLAVPASKEPKEVVPTIVQVDSLNGSEGTRRDPFLPVETPSWSEQLGQLLSETPPRYFNYGQPGGAGFSQAALITPSYRVTWFPEASVAGQPTNLSAVREDFRLAVPVWKDECQMVGLSLGVRNVLYNTQAVLPGTTPTQPFPSELWDVQFGVNYRYLFANGWSVGGTASFGSASDRPFGSINELTLGVSGFLRIPVGEHNAWLFSIAYSPLGELNFPIPGVAFYWQPNDSFNASIGIPFRVMWRPVEDVTLEATYMPLTTVKAKASWRVWGGVSLYTAYDRGNESYFLYDRTDNQDRFFSYDQRVTGGVKLEFGRQCVVDLSSGYAFNRYFFEGQNSSDQNNHRVDVANSPFLTLMVEFRY